MKKCKICRLPVDRWPIQPINNLARVCSIECARLLVQVAEQQKRKKEQRKKNAKDKERIKTNTERLDEAQRAVNAWIRWRDRFNPCISCGRPNDSTHQRQASHYRSVGACSELRFNTHNIHASCAQCNGPKSGNITEYRIRLVSLKGEDFVLWLESRNSPTRYSNEYLIRIKKIFHKRLRMSQKRYN